MRTERREGASGPVFPPMSPIHIITLVAVALLRVSQAWITCDDGTLCPDGNTCCAGSCISGTAHDEDLGECCDSSFGCGSSYKCANDSTGYAYCEQVAPYQDDKPKQLPRYRLCSVEPRALQQVHGLRMGCFEPQLAYLSTMGALDAGDPTSIGQHLQVETLLIMIHGSSRNVDDYLCQAAASVHDKHKTMVVAPWFAAEEDLPFDLYNTSAPALWWSEPGPIWHTWRYGADAVNANVSSYAAVDAIIDLVTDDVVRFPRLKRIVVAGHSAGGQYVQRWAFLSPNAIFQQPSRPMDIRAVVANPKSFVFMDDRRFVNGEFVVPSSDEIGNCTTYNDWEWGITGNGTNLLTPYKDAAIRAAGGVDRLVQRYASRNVVYIAGELDVLLNGDCEEQMQGPYRRKRSELFMESLSIVFGRRVHHRLVVAGVHHDHGLMFQSPEGQQAMFGSL